MRGITRLLNAFSEPPFWSLPTPLFSTGAVGLKETIGNDFNAYVEGAYKSNGIVFTCVLVRQMVFSEARFLWRQFVEGRPGDMFATSELELLDNPMPNSTTGELLSRMEQDNSLAGNFYGVRIEDEHGLRLRRLRPDWVTVLTGSPTEDPFDYRARPIGYVYHPKDRRFQTEPEIFTVDQIVHWSPLPDPIAQWRGMSWISPILDEIRGDKAATKHKLKFFEHGAVPGMIIAYDASVGVDDLREYVKLFEEEHAGIDNAYKALHIGGGADPKTVGATIRQLDFKALQGSSETRVAAASLLGAVMAQFSEGLAGSSLNVGNFDAARKRSETILFRPLWRSAAAALESVLTPPDGAHLWYDTRDVAFLRDDATAEASIRAQDASTIASLYRSGYEPDSVIDAVTTGDYTRLVHTGRQSVQTLEEEPADDT